MKNQKLFDYFAGSALQARLTDPESRGCYDDFARDAYNYAEAMMKERAKRMNPIHCEINVKNGEATGGCDV